MKRSRALVSREPRNDLWNNTYVIVLHRPGLCCVQAWIKIFDRRWIRVLLGPRQWNRCYRVNVCLLR